MLHGLNRRIFLAISPLSPFGPFGPFSQISQALEIGDLGLEIGDWGLGIADVSASLCLCGGFGVLKIGNCDSPDAGLSLFRKRTARYVLATA